MVSGAVTSDGDGVGVMLCCGHKTQGCGSDGGVILSLVCGEGKDNNPGISYSYSLTLTHHIQEKKNTDSHLGWSISDI